MPNGESNGRTNELNLRLAAAVAEIEGLHAALLRTRDPRRRELLLADLSGAAGRLTALTSCPPGQRPPRPPANSRWRRRRILAEGGASWLFRRLADKDGSPSPRS